MVIETKTIDEWFDTLDKHYTISNIRIEEPKMAYTAFLDLSNTNVQVGRVCTQTGLGVVRDRRNEMRSEGK